MHAYDYVDMCRILNKRSECVASLVREAHLRYAVDSHGGAGDAERA